MKEDPFSLDKFPALKEYIEGIKAEPINFKKYLIKEYIGGHYYIEKEYIKITEDGEVECADEYKPTEEVARAIKAEIISHKDKWPYVIAFSELQLKELLKTLRKDNSVYRFYLRGNKLAKIIKKHNLGSEANMIMLQVRYNNEDGSKTYKPWSYFSDGHWRMMECDDKLPFFKPEKKTRSVKIMLHEGPKAASAAQDIADDYNAGKSKHPWAKEIAEYEHWGIIGGALATNRSDYSELIDEKSRDVVYMCDNDELGKSSVPKVSQMYGRKMNVIRFDERWPSAWDIADKMPEQFYEGNKYIGPNLNALIQPATWATKEVPNPDGKKKAYDLTDSFMEVWAFCVIPKMFINIDKPSYYYNEEQFNDLVKNFSHVKQTSDLLINKFSTKVDELMYDPSKKSGIYTVGTNRKDSRVKFNMHVAPTIDSKKGDNKLWIDYMEHMFPDKEDRYQMQRWIATLIARPDIKINYAVLLISEMQGVGKSTLASYILAPLLGEHNVSYPDESIITESRFTSWQVRKRLAVVNEIYAGHSYKAYNKLKSVITEPTITVEEKYQPNYDIQNWCNIFACSNDERAIKFAIDDRRWLVPLVTEKKWGAPNWKKFHDWLKVDGLCVIKKWAEDFVDADDANVIMPGEEAPMTRRKRQVYEVMLSDGERLVLDRLTSIKEKMIDASGDEIPFFVSVGDLRELIRNELHTGKSDMSSVESAYRIKKLLKSNGYFSTGTRLKCPGGIMSELISNDKSSLDGSFSTIEKHAKQVKLFSDNPNEISLQRVM